MSKEKDQRRLGKFEIAAEIIDENPDVVRRIMSECIVVRAEMMFDRKCVAYTAIVQAFNPVDPGGEPPDYDVQFDSEQDEITWVRA